jgi:hypothetical protein
LPHDVAINAAKRWIIRYCKFLERLETLLSLIGIDENYKMIGCASDGAGRVEREFSCMQPVCLLLPIRKLMVISIFLIFQIKFNNAEAQSMFDQMLATSSSFLEENKDNTFIVAPGPSNASGQVIKPIKVVGLVLISQLIINK